MSFINTFTCLAALFLAACGAEAGQDLATQTEALKGDETEVYDTPITEDSASRIQTGDPITECAACADDEWGSYVRICCTTYNGVKTCRQEGCRRPGGDTLPSTPSDSGDLPSVDYDQPKVDVMGK